MKPNRNPDSVPSTVYPKHIDAWMTCFKCKDIGQWSDTFNGKSICRSCLHEVRFGEAELVCAKRGYHETNGASSYSDFRMVELDCACSKTARYQLSCDDGTFSADDYPQRWVVGDHGYAVDVGAA